MDTKITIVLYNIMHNIISYSKQHFLTFSFPKHLADILLYLTIHMYINVHVVKSVLQM